MRKPGAILLFSVSLALTACGSQSTGGPGTGSVAIQISPTQATLQAPEAAGLASVQLGHTQRAFLRGQSHRPTPISKSPTT